MMAAMDSPSSQPPAFAPQCVRFGRYETLFRIGAGGMAEVFVARLLGESGFERLVALKRPLPHLSLDPAYVERFLDEARLGARVRSGHVVQTLDVGRTEEGDPFMVMELVVGMALDHLLARGGALPPEVALGIAADVAEGLHAAHTACAADGQALGIVHRDVSPHNVLVGDDGRARIGDFGIAQAALLKHARTPTGAITGKLAYFSPEQAAGKKLDARSDVFSLGIVAWEALTGRALFAAGSPGQVMDAVRAMDVPPPHEVQPDVPAAASPLVLRALARDPDERFANALEFAQALHALSPAVDDLAARQAVLHTRADPSLHRLRSQVHAVPNLPQAADTTSPPVHGPSRWLWAFAAAALLLAGAAWWLPSNAKAPARTDPPPTEGTKLAAPALTEPMPSTGGDAAAILKQPPATPRADRRKPAPATPRRARRPRPVATPPTRSSAPAPREPPSRLMGMDAFEAAAGPDAPRLLRPGAQSNSPP